MKTYGELFLTLDIRDRQVVSFAPRPLYPVGKSPPVPVEREAAWNPELFWTT
jgi:hypothetical protein